MLFLANYEVLESALEILCYLSDLKMSTRLYLAKRPNLIPRLLALIAGNISKQAEKTAKLASMILQNLAVAPATKQYFVAYEKDIFSIATIDDTVSDILSSILVDIEPLSNSIYSQSSDFYANKKKNLQSAKPFQPRKDSFHHQQQVNGAGSTKTNGLSNGH